MIDPSYIRNIRDGLKSGHIESNNLDALPEGLVGLYDKELFPPTMKWKERKETLQFFLVFALAQKEISADFASTILGDEWFKVLANENETTEEKRLKKVNEFIQLHSKRFTSAGEGKYRLYHERFRVYILQKVSEGDLAQFNQLLISLCESELKKNTEKDISEKERYALQFLSTHYFISAMQGEKVCLNKEHSISLKNLAYDQLYWDRQVKARKGFEWSKKMLNEMMQWASKFDDEEVIECALNKVDLYHQEQNDAPRIVQLVADGDIETVLARIEKFGGEDKDGLQRKFILYMLCLMELTLLESKDKEHSKGSIEKILKHLDEHLPIDYSLLNWEEFFPRYLTSQILRECDEMSIHLIYERTNASDIDYNEEAGSNYEIREIIYNLDDDDATKIISLLEQSNHHFKTNSIQSANEIIESVAMLFEESRCVFDLDSPTQIAFFRFLIIELVHQKKHSYLQRCINLILDETRHVAFKIVLNQIAISKDYVTVKSLLFDNMIENIHLNHQKILDNVFDKYLEIKQFYRANIILNHPDSFLEKEKQIKIIKSFIQNGLLNDAVNFSKKYLNEEIEVYFKSIVKIALAYRGKGDSQTYNELIDEASNVLKVNSELIDFVEICIFLLKLNDFDNSVQIINEIILINDFDSVTNSGYLTIVFELAKNCFFDIAIEVANRIDYEFARIDAYTEISRQMALHGLSKKAKAIFELAINEVDKISIETSRITKNERKCRALMEKLIPEWCLKEWPEIIGSNFNRSLDLAYIIENPMSKSYAYHHIAIGYLKCNKLRKALEIVEENITDEDIKKSTLNSMVSELLKLNDLTNSLLILMKINSSYYFNEALINIVKKYANVGSIEVAAEMLTKIDQPEENNSVINEMWCLIILKCVDLDLWNKIEYYLMNLPKGLRNDCLLNIGLYSAINKGLIYTLGKVYIFKEDDTRKFIQDGIYKAIDINNIEKEIVLATSKNNSQNIANAETALKYYSLKQLFFSDLLPQEKLDRYNRTLNLQWAIDIKKQLPN